MNRYRDLGYNKLSNAITQRVRLSDEHDALHAIGDDFSLLTRYKSVSVKEC